MHYKLQFHPAYVLCYTTRVFVDEKTAKPYLEQHSLCLDPQQTPPSEDVLKELRERMLLIIDDNDELSLMTYPQAVEKYKEVIISKLDPFLKFFIVPIYNSLLLVKV